MNTKTQVNSANPSICIPRVFNNITRERVYRIFAQLFGGSNVERIDMVSKMNKEGQPIKRVFVHFKSGAWDKQPEMRESLINGKEVKIVYDDPWYWKCLCNTGTKRDAHEPRATPAPRVEIGAAEVELPKPRELTMTSAMVDVSDKAQPSKKKKKKGLSFEEYDEKQRTTPDKMKAVAKAEVANELQRVASSVAKSDESDTESSSSSDSDDDELTTAK